MVVCVPVTAEGEVDPTWGRAERLAIAVVEGGGISKWEEHQVGWGELHDLSGEGGHHARVARFLLDHGVQRVVAHHMGEPMVHMLGKMGLEVRLGAAGSARRAVETQLS
ncbi:MAG: NifB/NifX family molybdenum-iron cluster-binding protein [Candidatus Dormiibacterota bacterium]